MAVAPFWMVPPLWLGMALVATSGVPALAGARARSWPDWVAGTQTSMCEVLAKATTSRRRDVRSDAAPPTLFTMLIGRKNARRFASDLERSELAGRNGRRGRRS
jgi:hypothetical protein